MAVVLCILRIDGGGAKAYNGAGAQISLAIKKSLTGTGFIPRPLKIKTFWTTYPINRNASVVPLLCYPLVYRAMGLRAVRRGSCAGGLTWLSWASGVHRLPPSHRDYSIAFPSGNVNTFFQKSRKFST